MKHSISNVYIIQKALLYYIDGLDRNCYHLQILEIFAFWLFKEGVLIPDVASYLLW
jgi:hypothetical protein